MRAERTGRKRMVRFGFELQADGPVERIHLRYSGGEEWRFVEQISAPG
jgi:hypothetical protein